MHAPTALVHAAKGAAIGVVEVLPGVSGGTVALLVGVYERLLASAEHLVRGLALAVGDPVRGRGLSRARARLAAVEWRFVLPIAVGMLAAVALGAAIVAPLVDEHPGDARALFLGLVLASVVVPARMVGGRWSAREWALAVPAAVLGFALTGLPAAEPGDAALWAVAGSAAVAVCALVLPGVSGSFLLLALGMYEPVLRAVNERDLPVLGAFALGAVVGLASFVRLLRWLLEHRRRTTLAIMTGLMVGSLRALWPWQAADGGLLPPGSDAPLMAGWCLLGMAVVAGALLLERRRAR